MAWAVHDLGIWTANTFDYLEKSADLAWPFAGNRGALDGQYRGTGDPPSAQVAKCLVGPIE